MDIQAIMSTGEVTIAIVKLVVKRPITQESYKFGCRTEQCPHIQTLANIILALPSKDV